MSEARKHKRDPEEDQSSSEESPSELKIPKTEPVTIGDIPGHILEQIIQCNYLDRRIFPLVCKAFYNATRQVYKNHYWLTLHTFDIVQNPQRLKILVNSIKDCRPLIFPNITVNFQTIQDTFFGETVYNYYKIRKEFWNFLEARGNFIRKLELTGQVTLENLTKLFSYVDNLESLSLETFKILPETFDVLDLSHLSRLKSIAVGHCDEFDFKKLKIDENSLKNFNFMASVYNKSVLDDLCGFFAPQTALKDVKIFYGHWQTEIHKDFLKTCQLETFEFNSNYNFDEETKRVFEVMLGSQRGLKKMICDVNLWDTFVETICRNITDLEHLIGNFKDVKFEAFRKIENLKKLKFLKIREGKFDEIFQMRIKADTVEELELDHFAFRGARTMDNLTKSFRNVKFLKIWNVIYVNLNFEIIFENFEKLAELRVIILQNYRTINLPALPRTYDNIKVLHIDAPIKIHREYLQNFPNLTDFEVMLGGSAKQLKNDVETICGCLGQLEILTVIALVESPLKLDLMDLLNRYSNLKIVHFVNFVITGSYIFRNRKELAKRFDIVKLYKDFKATSLLMAANLEILRKNRNNFSKHLLLNNSYDDLNALDFENIYKSCFK